MRGSWGTSSIYKRTEGQERGDGEDKYKGDEDILLYGGDWIETSGGTIKAKYQRNVNGEGPGRVISGIM